MTVWSEDRIRDEIKRLDEITGLCGVGIRIKFGRSAYYLGRFFAKNKEGQMEFYFSNVFFQDPSFREEYAVDVIRHEYAHYMNWVLNHKVGHGNSWKRCCKIVGAKPDRIFKSNETERENITLDNLKRLFSGVGVFFKGYKYYDGYGVIERIEKRHYGFSARVIFHKLEKDIPLKDVLEYKLDL